MLYFVTVFAAARVSEIVLGLSVFGCMFGSKCFLVSQIPSLLVLYLTSDSLVLYIIYAACLKNLTLI